MLICVYCHGEIKGNDCLVTELGHVHAECKDAALNFKMPQFMKPTSDEIDIACRIWLKRNK